MASQQDISRKAMDKVVLETIELLLYAQADMINAIMRDGVQFTKMTAPQIGG